MENIEKIQSDSQEEIDRIDSLESLDKWRVKYLGRKEGLLTRVLQSLPRLAPDERKKTGKRANELKTTLEELLDQKRKSLQDAQLNQKLTESSRTDLTLPGTPLPRGGRHPLTQTLDEIVGIFRRLGFDLAEGPEVETDFNNFTALNHPPDHPARDAHDTFYLKDFRDASGPLLLRTHTSPVQIRYMKSHKPPLHIIAPGRVFRHEAVDATHSFVFHQVEGLSVGRDVSLADLKGGLTLFARHLFGSQAGVRFRQSFYPFVEPGLDLDISCPLCRQRGCRVCKNTGWLEMLGAGMVHPNVFRAVGYNPRNVTGYAFGIGIERVAMFKYGVDDMRLFYENNIRFLQQFSHP